MTIKDWSTTPANNNAAVPEGAPEGWLFADVNNVVRQIMAHLRTAYNDAAWIEYGDGDGAYTSIWIGVNSIRIDGSDQTSQYHANRRIRITGSISGVTIGNITSSSFATGNTTVNVSNTLNGTNETISKVEILSVRADNSGVALLAANNTFTGTNTFDCPIVIPLETVTPTTGAITLDLNADVHRRVTLTGDPTFSTSNRGDGKVLEMSFVATGTQRTLTFPAWVFLGPKPTVLAANKRAILTLRCYGGADTDIDAIWVVQL